MAKQKRRSYLDDFQRDVSGEYHYKGAHYRYAGAMDYRKLRRRLWLCAAPGAGMVLAAGCLPGATVGAAWYVTLPYMAALLAAGIALWTLAQWSRGGMTLRASVYAKTVRRMPGEFLTAAIFAALAAAGQGSTILFENSSNFSKLANFFLLFVAVFLNMRAFVLAKRTSYDFIDANK